MEVGTGAGYSDTIPELRKSGKPFSIESLIETLSQEVSGKEFDLSGMADSMAGELRDGSLVACKEYGWFFFDPKHVKNKWQHLLPPGEKSFREAVISGEETVKDHKNQYGGFY
jgi:hypothetical protein